jgi:hypothetical protein
MKFGTFTLYILLAIMVGALPAAAQNSSTEDANFRAAHWGQSPSEIIAQEKSELLQQDDNLIIYRDQFRGTPAEVIYFFVDNKLIMGFTHLLIDNEDLEEYFTKYDQVKSYLGENIGIPDVENWNMSLPELEEDRSMWADGLGFGLIKAEAGWVLNGTGVALRLSGGNFKGHLTLVHFSLDDMDKGRIAYKKYYAQKAGVPNEYFHN